MSISRGRLHPIVHATALNHGWSMVRENTRFWRLSKPDQQTIYLIISPGEPKPFKVLQGEKLRCFRNLDQRNRHVVQLLEKEEVA